MRSSTKGALLSGLVFPGLGQIFLKRYPRGLFFLVATAASLTLVMIEAVDQAFAILENIDLQGGAVDIDTLSNAASQAANSAGGLSYNLLWWLIIFCWITSIIDAYLTGKAKDRA